MVEKKSKQKPSPDKIRTIIVDAFSGSSFGLRRDLSRIVSMELSERDITALRKALEKIESMQSGKRVSAHDQCVTRALTHQSHPTAFYLADGTKIVIVRSKGCKGAVWLEVKEQSLLRATKKGKQK